MFVCRITVDDIYDAQEVRLVYDKDLFTCKISVSTEYAFDLNGKIEVKEEPEGSKIDYQVIERFGVFYDIASTIEVKWLFLKNIWGAL